LVRTAGLEPALPYEKQILSSSDAILLERAWGAAGDLFDITVTEI
jgi:hypothetical protein